MIVDTHVYVFRAPDEPAGHASGAEHLGYWQWGYALHHQPAIRTRDHAIVPGADRALLDPTPDDPTNRATNRDFRADHTTGRLVWTVDGEEYTKLYLPPNVLAFTPGMLIAEMDYAGVDWALNHVDMALDKGNDYFAEAVRAYPDRIVSMAQVDEWRIGSDTDAVIREVTDAIRVKGLHAIKIIPEYAYRIARPRGFDEPAWRPFWDAASQLGVPIFFTLGSTPDASDERSGFISELNTLKRLSTRYPDLRVSVTHGFPWRAWLNAGRTGFDMPGEMWEPFKDSRIHLEVSFPIRIGDVFDYPYRECWPMLEALVRNIGADRLVWGTDMPFQNRFCTYRQSRDYIERYAPSFLDATQIADIMGGTAARLLGLPAKAPAAAAAAPAAAAASAAP
jgi:predicted TIM-barrel fold metal-dependent hydrolase